ncbi:MAG: TetR/AcrR family transcriptional regulator, partial [Dehalococcoidia bacterium]
MGHRKYELGKRAERQDETRRRIVAATMELHGTVGPLATTVSAVADLAGVERLTVYRHFPTLHELFESCGALFMETYPLPALTSDPAPSSPFDRIRATLGALYPYYRDREAYLSVFLRDVEQMPELQVLVDTFVLSKLRGGQEWIVAGFAGSARPAVLAAVIGQAMDFWGWRSWKQQGLTDGEIIEVVATTAV